MIDTAIGGYLAKAEESTVGAESELDAGRADNASSRAYYAAFQAAIAALLAEGVLVALGKGGTISHKGVNAAFAGQLIHRRKVYSSRMKHTLPWLIELRHRADYLPSAVGAGDARASVSMARDLVEAVVLHVRATEEGK